MNKTVVFFRDDDVGELTHQLKSVVELLVAEEIPCNYQVVPVHLDTNAAKYMRHFQRQNPDLISLNQHGYRHQQVLRGKTVATEFAGKRKYEDQKTDIALGRSVLEDMLGESFDGTIFTPPCNRYDINTLRALGEVDCSILSGIVHVSAPARLYYLIGRTLGQVYFLRRCVSYHLSRTPAPKLVEVSVAIDVDEAMDLKGNLLTKDVETIWREFELARRVTAVVGVMLHHNRYTDSNRLEVLREFVLRLKSDEHISFSTIGQIADGVSTT